MNRYSVINEDHMISFWMLATCQCGALARAHINFCLYCFGGDVFVNHQGCGPQLTSCNSWPVIPDFRLV